jgi:2-polyprenyl-3-methyl-5-hydroxy-6-metoxy-1,4-benzoquinol methylase
MDARTAWEDKAAFWDGLMGETGNLFQTQLVGPTAEKLLALKPGERVLDLACGNGVFARRMVELGATVTAVDFSENMIALARARPYGDQIHYDVADATDESALFALGTFDAVVCNMAIMDIPDINPMLGAVRQMLTVPSGRFVFTLMHPCFNFSNSCLMVEEQTRDDGWEVVYAVKVVDYLKKSAKLGAGAPGEPNPHPYYHRPLHDLLGSVFAAGWVLDALEEPAMPEDTPPAQGLSWRNFHHIPPILAARLRSS